MVTRDTYLQPDAADPVLESATVLDIVRRYAPKAREVTEVDETGGEARAYMVDAGVVLKTQRPHRLRARTSLEKEAFLLDQIARHGHVSVPRVLGYGREDSVEYLCMTRMSGVAVRSLRLEGEDRMRLLRDIGRTLARLHSMPQTEVIASPLMPGDRHSGEYQMRMRALLDQALEVFRADPSIWALPIPADVVAAALVEQLQPPEALVALHSNPGPEHAFADPKTRRFTGLIDFGDSYISHPALDLRPWPPSDRAGLIEGYVDEALTGTGTLEGWRTVWAIGDMSIAAHRPQRRAVALEGLMQAVRELGI